MRPRRAAAEAERWAAFYHYLSPFENCTCFAYISGVQPVTPDKLIMLPSALQQLIDTALVEVRSRTNTDVFPAYLQIIGSFFGDLKVQTLPLDHVQQRRLMLTLLSLQSALPVWEQAWPDDPTPHHLVRDIERLVRTDFTTFKLEAVYDRVGNWLDPYLKRAETPPLMIGYGLSTLMDALVAMVDGVVIDSRTPDQQANVAILFAAGAYAGGSFSDTSFEAARWFRFWERWLTEIVPNAWYSIVE